MDVYVECGVALASKTGCAVWVFDLEHWGHCGQGPDEDAAIADLATQVGRPASIVVVERIHGDERAFERDRHPCRADERATTLRVLAAARRRTLGLARECSDAVLDWDDPERTSLAGLVGGRCDSWRGTSRTPSAVTTCRKPGCRPGPGPRTC